LVDIKFLRNYFAPGYPAKKESVAVSSALGLAVYGRSVKIKL